MKKYLISGGGTGGHIFPAVSIANELRRQDPNCEILFVGAEGRMEMERVPAAGYNIVGLKVEGLDRKNIFRNVKVVWNLLRSMAKVRGIIKEFQPDVAVGVGGYASGAALKVAQQMGIPIVLQEQNSFAGVTNKMLAKGAEKICVAYTGMERFFPAEKIILTGNPVRQNLLAKIDKQEAYEYFGLNPDKPTLMVMGGSLGARTINQAMIAGLERLRASGIQVIWQTGKLYYEMIKSDLSDRSDLSDIKILDFLSRMDYAYAVADLVVSRAGASSISELSLLGKPSILVPSPNVAEDHQTHNARALSDKGAAILVRDVEAVDTMVDTALATIASKEKLQSLSDNVLKLAYPNSAEKIVNEILKLGNKE
ncbi:MAG: undecaprenyldiphospho-muramoylpentapeptide beta-N-acetylglucosaminyltransferase [Paludibacteraceae bacterium]|nr:undecaprenyldiphospho-muramoylpentapeptide beta-N-acetylglucosaminyltransferase [Paludibacteraceae bacterium]